MGHKLNQLWAENTFLLFQVTIHYWGKPSQELQAETTVERCLLTHLLQESESRRLALPTSGWASHININQEMPP